MMVPVVGREFWIGMCWALVLSVAAGWLVVEVVVRLWWA